MAFQLPSTTKILALEAQVASLTTLIEGTGLFTLAKAEDGTLNLAQTQKATDLFALGDVSAELETASAHLKEATDSNLELQRAVDGYKAAFPANGFFAFADGKVILTDTGRAKLINAEAASVLASSGHRPLPIAAGVDSAPGATANAGLSRKQRAAKQTQASLESRGLVPTHTS